ncbi:M56 family metallopeptidase [Pseudoflavitalea sp. X16]|uniref:M56 family metallopeptidase n=1 Tax=Paraflavitalea devenefica TaxID=2716334 RepID=UPI001424402F|nr:M56 family metallopeptidase [Paraflavitalea devenefica]NII27635.1 M56 family metallopeptidase [Paraflavitalea devenefica]
MMPYIAHVGLILAGCLIFYKLLLQKETFFRTNRWVLLACLALSFSLPLIEVPQQWSFRQATIITTGQEELPPAGDEATNFVPEQPATAAPATTTATTPAHHAPAFTGHDAATWAWRLYWAGVIIFGINFLIQLITLLYRAYTNPFIQDGRFRIVEITGDKAPCSFWNCIFINPEKYDWDTYNQILLHEKTHIEQRHSLDLLIAEIVIIFQWFNPFAWQYRKELENNLEYLTDDQLLHHEQVEKESYQMSLLKVSAPHFPLHLTTNYNQSLLKKRIAMMNVKKSNVHTVWKYGFLLPVLVLLVCLLNKPVVYAHTPVTEKKGNTNGIQPEDMDTEGVWFATIKEDKVSIQFRNEDDDHSTNSTTFTLSELGELPKDKAGVFTVTREAGSMQFSGRFEGDQGMGRYKFTPNASFADNIRKEGIELRHDRDIMTFFLVNVTQGYVKMLKANGYTELKRNDVIPLAAMKVDEAYIQSIKKSGIAELSLRNLIPFKALGINGDYIADIRKAGYPNVTANQLISFKSQGIDGKYIADIRSSTAVPAKSSSTSKENKSNADSEKNVNVKVNTNADVEVSANNIVAFKSLNIDAEYTRSIKETGLSDLSANRLIALKSQHITADYIKSLQAAGFKELSASNVIAFKSLGVDADYARSLKESGLGDLSPNRLISLKSQNVTADYIKSLQAAGFKNLSANDVISIKSQQITPEYVKSFEALGYKDISPRQVIPLKSLDVTPEFVKGFLEMGYKDFSLRQAVSLKSQNITPALIKEYTALGFEQVSINEVITAKSTGATPAFIASMKAKGHNLKSLQKYVQLKTIVD